MSSIQQISTADGSSSLYLPDLDETYHSRHGAIQESHHVFIQNGLLRFLLGYEAVRVFEMGFGTGLNALLSWRAARKGGFKVEYHTVEKYPISPEVAKELNYGSILNDSAHFDMLHDAEWGQINRLSPDFKFTKERIDLDAIEIESFFDIIYYDAFGPRVQPNMWSLEKLERATSLLRSGGIFVTYCAQGQFRRNLRSLGLAVEVLPGPPGKREMTMATKHS